LHVTYEASSDAVRDADDLAGHPPPLGGDLGSMVEQERQSERYL
jgi:hypothetical protein